MKPMRAFLALALSVFAAPWCLGQAPTPTDKVTFRHTAAPVGVVMKALREQTGAQVDAAAALWNEVVLVDVKDVTLRDLLDRLAKLTDCQWIASGQTAMLVRAPELERESARQELAARSKAIQAELDKFAKGLNVDYRSAAVQDFLRDAARMAGSSGEAEEANYRELSKRARAISGASPKQRLATRLLMAIGPEALAGVGAGDKVVFSNRPNAMQVAFPRGSQAAFAQYQRDVNAAEGVLSASGAGAQNWMLMDWRTRKGAGPLTRVVMSVERTDNWMMSGLAVQLCLFDDQGRIIGRDYRGIMQGGMFAGINAEAEWPDAYGAAELGEATAASAKDGSKKVEPVPVQLSPLSQSILTSMTAMAKAQSTPSIADINPEVRSAMVNPTGVDPLSHLVSDLMLSRAQSKHANVIAEVPDSAIVSLFLGVMGESDAPDFKAMLSAADIFVGCRVEEGDGWMLVRPLEATAARLERVNRDALQRFLRSLPNGMPADFDSMTDFAASGEVCPFGNPILMLQTIFIDPVLSSSIEVSEAPAARLYGKLASPQKRVLAKGGALPFGTLNRTQSRLLRRVLLSQYGNWDGDDSESPDAAVSGAPEEEVKGAPLNGPDDGEASTEETPEEEPLRVPSTDELASVDATEAMPRGIPSDGFITMKVEEHDVVFARYKSDEGEQDGELYPMEVEEVAWSVAAARNPKMMGEGGGAPKVGPFQVGRRRTIKLQFHVSPKLVRTASFTTSWKAGKADAVPLEKLPASIRQKIEARAAEIAKQAEETEKTEAEGR